MEAIEIIREVSLNPAIFREYDIRGEFGRTLLLENAYDIGMAFANYLINKSENQDEELSVIVCRDGRLSSPALFEQLTRGLLDAGVDVIDIGVGPTPMMYFSLFSITNAAAGIMVTGSHNPKTHNGFKFMVRNESFFGDKIRRLEHIIRSGIEPAKMKGQMLGSMHLEMRNNYIGHLVANTIITDDLKIAWDAGNGASGDVVNILTKLIPGHHIVLNKEINGNFPNHDPDPTISENLEQLRKAILTNKCDFGVAFDGDADRVVVLDENGKMISGDNLLALFSQQAIENKKDSIIIADVKTSQTLFDYVNNLGAQSVMWKTGHSLIKAKMKEIGADFAGEMSGHIFFASNNGVDDGIFAAIKFIELVSNKRAQDHVMKVSEIANILPEAFNTEEMRIYCKDEIKFKVIDDIKAKLEKEGGEFKDIDGIRVSHLSGWWLLRASNTQEALVARCEAMTLEDLTQIQKKLAEYLSEHGISVV